MKTEDKMDCLGILLIVFMIGGLILFSQAKYNTSNGVLWQEETRVKTEHDISYISIPGFSEIHFVTNKTDQDFSFYNPASNHCIMDLELQLPDGETLFTESNIQPGYGIKEVQLNKELQNGNYDNCKFVIRCYSSDGVFYNGATLTVKLFIR